MSSEHARDSLLVDEFLFDDDRIREGCEESSEEIGRLSRRLKAILFLPDAPSLLVSLYVGVDGCPGGWFAVGYDPESNAPVAHDLQESFAAVVEAHADAERLLVDMPIGLPESGRRRCDEAARQRLGSRASTVFFAPCRAVLEATDHTEASALNREHTGYGLSIQAWNLVPRIREVDEQLRVNPSLRSWIAESHPELCFAALDGGPVAASKSTSEGRSARLDALRSAVPTVDEMYESCLDTYYRTDVQRDDVLDAAVLAIAASRPLARISAVSDGAVPRDAMGLPMEILAPMKE